MTLDIVHDSCGYYYTIENVTSIRTNLKYKLVIFGEKLISELLYEGGDQYKSEKENSGLVIESGMLVMYNSKENPVSWDLRSESDIIQMSNQIQLLMGLEEV